MWADYARNGQSYIDFGLRFFTTAIRNTYPTSNGLRRNETSLGRFTRGTRLISGETAPDLTVCPTESILAWQNNLLEKANSLKGGDGLKGILSWLFCAPFKIILIHRRDLWSDSRTDSIVMPVGSKVISTLKYLKKMKHPSFEALDESLLRRERGLLEEGGLTLLTQDCCKRLAARMRTRVMHVNSGLYVKRLPTSQD